MCNEEWNDILAFARHLQSAGLWCASKLLSPAKGTCHYGPKHSYSTEAGTACNWFTSESETRRTMCNSKLLSSFKKQDTSTFKKWMFTKCFLMCKLDSGWVQQWGKLNRASNLRRGGTQNVPLIFSSHKLSLCYPSLTHTHILIHIHIHHIHTSSAVPIHPLALTSLPSSHVAFLTHPGLVVRRWQPRREGKM